LQKTALEILEPIDPSPHTRNTASPQVKPSNHHSSKDPREALLQRTIQIHRDALTTPRKDLSLDDTDTLTYRQNKLKQAQNDLLKSQIKKRITNYGPTLHVTMEMTEYAKILALCGIISENTRKITLTIFYHLKLAPTHPPIPESGKADLLPSIYLTGNATDSPWVHHLFNRKLSPYEEKEAELIFPRHTSVQVQASTTTPHTDKLGITQLKPRSRNSFQTSLLALLESLIGCYKLETLNFNP